jgi:tetratricopeptide (TPR) repeat protein
MQLKNNSDYYNKRILVEIATNAINDTMILSLSAKEKSKDLSIFFFIRGIAYIKLKQIDNAIKDLDEVRYYDSTYPQIPYYKAMAYYECGYFSKAKSHFYIAKNEALKIGNEKQVIEINEKIKELNKLLLQAK